MKRSVFEELLNINSDNFQKKAHKVEGTDEYKLYMKYNGEWLFSGRYTKEGLNDIWGFIVD